MKSYFGWIVAALATVVAISPAQDGPSLRKRSDRGPASQQATQDYRTAVHRTGNMTSDSGARSLVERYGLDLLSLTWEDTGRYKGSSVGPNISDMTIQVGMEDPRTRRFEAKCMPVIRFPNFSDKTCDIDPQEFTLLVGNQHGKRLQRVSLYDFLKDPTSYMSNPSSWRGRNKTLWAPRDSKVLASAQACFLPVPKQGLATFNPVLFNYQSVSGDPAVLTILATREGTSVTVIDNKRDAFAEGSAWGQRLFHNQNGQRASLTGQRISDFQSQSGRPSQSKDNISGLNMVLLIQVPLKQKNVMRYKDMATAPMSAPAGGAAMSKRGGSDVEAAVIGHGEMEGPFTEIDNLNIERDPNFPVRVTVQFYKATSNGVVSDEDLRQIRDEIDSVYEQSDSVGSLVTGGDTGRVTEYLGVKVQPRDWWEQFWRRHEQNTGDTRLEATAKLRRLLGQDYMQRPVCALYVRDLLRKK